MKRPTEPVQIPGVEFEISAVPLRNVVRRGATAPRHLFCSRKMKGPIEAESGIELAFIIRAELDPTITAIYAQATRVSWRDDTGPRHHTPDFIILRDGRAEVHEVKPNAHALTEKVRSTTDFASGYYSERGACYGLALESVIKAEPTYSNALQAIFYVNEWIDEGLARAAVAHVQDQGPLAIKDLAAALNAKGCTAETAFRLVAHNRLHVDYRQPFDRNAVLHASYAAFSHAPLLPRVGKSGSHS